MLPANSEAEWAATQDELQPSSEKWGNETLPVLKEAAQNSRFAADGEDEGFRPS